MNAKVKTAADIERGIIAQLQGERMARGWDIAAAARHAGMAPADLEAVEMGERRLTVLEFVKYCTALQTHPKYVLEIFKNSDFGGQDSVAPTSLHDVVHAIKR